MGLCASSSASPVPPGDAHSGDKPKNSLIRKTVADAENVTEKAVEIMMKAKRRMVVHDQATAIDKNFVFPMISKSTKERNFLRQCLEETFFLFKELDTDSQEKMLDAMDKKDKIETRDIIIKQGDEGDFMYVVEAGQFEVLSDDIKVGTKGKGQMFGELALLYQCPRAATIRCINGPAILWKLERKVFTNIANKVNAAASKSNFEKLSKCELLKDLRPSQQRAIADVLVRKGYKKGENIILKGDKGTNFYIIDEGSVICINDEDNGQTDLVLNAGQYFGEIALTQNVPRQRTVRCREDTTCLILDKTDFNNLLGNLQDAIDANMGQRVLKSVEVFNSLTPHMHNLLVDAFKERVYKGGDTIIKQNDVGDSFFVVNQGTLKCFVEEEGKLKDTSKRFQSGEYFGETALLDGKPRNATIIAEGGPKDRIRLFQLMKSDFDRLLGPVKAYIEKTSQERKELSKLKKIALDELKVIRNLGQGTFGLVKLVEYDGKHYALKCLQKKQIVRYNLVDNILYEKRMMEESNHPFVLKLINTFQNQDQLYMMLEVVPGGELFAFLQTRGGFVPTNHARFISACVVSVFEYMHSKDICYRDLKPENLMIDAQGYIKMVDFGFAKVVTSKTFTLCGTPEYMAPEILLRRGHNKSVDYWATGILIYECETGNTPFADYENYDNAVICQKILRSTLKFPSGINKDAKSLITRLLHRDVSKRFGCMARGTKDIKEHDYYNYGSFNWNHLISKKLKAPYVPKVSKAKGISTENFATVHADGKVEPFNGNDAVFSEF